MKNGAGQIVYSSNWIALKSVERKLSGGNIQVRGSNLGSTSAVITAAPKNEEEAKPVIREYFDIKVFGNPSPTQFTLIPESSTDKPITIRVMDMNGKMLERRENIASGQLIRFGNNYKNGVYLAEITQGDQRKVVRLVKQ